MQTIIHVLLISLLIPALLFCYIAFSQAFPKNILKIPSLLVLPITILIIGIIDLPLLIFLLRGLAKNCYDIIVSPHYLVETLLTTSLWNLLAILCAYVAFSMLPSLITYWVSNNLKESWRNYKKISTRYTSLSGESLPATHKVPLRVHIVESFILHPLAILTAYDSAREELMVDVRTSDGFLFSGKYVQYFLDEKKLSGVSLSHVIKYDLRRSKIINYLIPNNGELHFFSEKIIDIHFWRLKKNSVINLNFDDENSATKLAWYCLLQYAFPDLKIRIHANIPPTIRIVSSKKLIFELARSGLRTTDVTIDFKKSNNS